jgi:hypothetical protein
MTLPFDADARVARGAALLDKINPAWWHEIGREQLSIGSCSRCVLGQLYGHYDHGVLALAGPVDPFVFGVQFGFAFQSSLSSGQWEAEDRALIAAWLAEIDTRVEAAANVASQHGAVAERTLDPVLV